MATVTIPETTERVETQPLPLETPKPLKLSEALRLGAMGTKQAFGNWTDADGAMCAMSTAWYALTGHEEHDAQSTQLVRLLDGRRVTNPETGHDHSLTAVIIDLNDDKKWPRHKIADWLESIGL